MTRSSHTFKPREIRGERDGCKCGVHLCSPPFSQLVDARDPLSSPVTCGVLISDKKIM